MILLLPNLELNSIIIIFATDENMCMCADTSKAFLAHVYSVLTPISELTYKELSSDEEHV